MNDYQIKIEHLIAHFDEKQNKQLQTDLFLRLSVKMGEEDVEISELINKTYQLLTDMKNDKELKSKEYIKSFRLLSKTVTTKFGYNPRGAIQENYTAVGTAVGMAIGTALLSINAGFIAIGIAIGLGIGIPLGKKMEKEAEESGKTY